MKFTVKTLDGKNQSYDLDGSTKVSSLKELVMKDLGIPPESQRMILQGKVLKDDSTLSSYGPEGKTIHLVKNAPPSVPIESKPPAVPVEMQTPKPSIDFMYVSGNLPPIPPPEGVPYLQDIAKKSADSTLADFKESIPGSNYLVTVTLHTLSADGRPTQSATHTSTTHSALIDNQIAAQEREEREEELKQFPQPLDKDAEEDLKKKKKEEEETRQRRIRLERYQERVREQQRRGREQTNILEIYQHMTSARRAIAGAENIVEEYFSSEEYKEAKEMLEHTLKLRAEVKEKERIEKEKMEADKKKEEEQKQQSLEEEPMEQESGATATGEQAPPTDEDGDRAEKKKEEPDYSIGEDGRPRQHILTDTGMLIPAGSALFTSLMNDLIALERRGMELQDFYTRKLEAEEHYELGDYKLNSKILTAVQRYHNALGQACDALKKIQVQLDTEPPRIVSLTSRPRPTTNPLLSLLSQPLSQLRDSDDEEESSGQQGGGAGGGGLGGGGESQSVAGLFGSLLAARALGSLMQEEESSSRGGSSSENRTSGGTTTTTEGGTQEGSDATGTNTTAGEDDDTVGNMFLPDPVRMMAEIAKENTRRRQQEQEERTVVIQPNEPFFEVISRIRQAVGGPEAEIMPPTIVGALIEMCFKKLTIVEVVTVFGGEHEPLNSLHATFREFIRTKLLNDQEPTNENTPEAIERFIEGIPAMLSELTPPLPLNPDIDFAASVQKCCRTVLKEAFDMIINTADDDAEFGAKIYKWAETSGTLLTCVVRESLLSANDLSPSLKRLAKLMFPDNDTPGVVSMLNSHTLVDKFVEDSENSSLTEEEIESYLVYVEDKEMETDPPKDQPQEEEEKTQSNAVPPPSTDDNYPSTMPKEWSGTIKNDVEEMKKTKSQPPLSSAYTESAGPSKKRKQLESGEAEPIHVSDIMTDSLQSAIDTTGSKPTSGTTVDDIVSSARQNSDLVQSFGDELHSTTRKRLEEDPNYNADKYPAAQEHYKPNN